MFGGGDGGMGFVRSTFAPPCRAFVDGRGGRGFVWSSLVGLVYPFVSVSSFAVLSSSSSSPFLSSLYPRCFLSFLASPLRPSLSLFWINSVAISSSCLVYKGVGPLGGGECD